MNALTSLLLEKPFPIPGAIPVEMKYCNNCCESKPKAEFRLKTNSRGAKYTVGKCITCEAKAQRDYRHAVSDMRKREEQGNGDAGRLPAQGVSDLSDSMEHHGGSHGRHDTCTRELPHLQNVLEVT